MKLSLAAAALSTILPYYSSTVVLGQEPYCCETDPNLPSCDSSLQCLTRDETCDAVVKQTFAGDTGFACNYVGYYTHDPNGDICCRQPPSGGPVLFFFQGENLRLSCTGHLAGGPHHTCPQFCCIIENMAEYQQSSNNCDPCDPQCQKTCDDCIVCASMTEVCDRVYTYLCDSNTLQPDPNGDSCCDDYYSPPMVTTTVNQMCLASFGGAGTMCGATHSGGGGNDPHFKTWAGQFFDYHGECDLVPLFDPQFYLGLGLVIHIRTKARYDYSFIESAAIQIGDDILEVSGFGQYMINGISQALSGEGFFRMADKFMLTHEQKNKKEHSFVIRIGSGGGDEQIVVTTFKDWVSVRVLEGTEAHFGKSIGLMGRFQDGAMVGRNGTAVGESVLQEFANGSSRSAFGQEWQVLDTEAQLFQTIRAPQYPQKCILPEQKAEGRRRLGEGAISQSEATTACSHWKDDKQQKMCVYDVMASGDLEVANVNPLF